MTDKYNYKDINLSYIDGILQVLREKYQTKPEVLSPSS